MSALLDQAIKACLMSGQYSLPLLPESTGRLMTLLHATEIDLIEVERLVTREAALAARVLRVANSPGWRGARPVTSIREALTRIGTRQVTRIALSEQVASVFNVPGFEELARSYWWDARLSSLYAAGVADHLGEDPDAAFVCGLLYAVGRPIVLQTVVQIASHLDEKLTQAEVKGWVEAWYISVGLRLGESWGLPQMVMAAIAHHHCPDQTGEHLTMVQITSLADLITRASPVDTRSIARLSQYAVVGALGLSAEVLEILVDPTVSGLLAA